VGGGTPDPAGTQPNVKNAQDPTGVQVALTVQGLAQPMVKAFLLGGT
jgi:general secretion pathway protein J